MLGGRITSFLKNHGFVLNLVFIVLGAYFVAGAANAVVARSIRVIPSIEDASLTPKSKRPATPSRSEQTLVAIAQRNLLGVKRENLQPISNAELDPGELLGNNYKESDLRPCSLAAQVRATLVADGAPEWSMAIIFDNTKQEPAVFSINEGSNRIAEDAVLIDVRSFSIVVRRRDHFELCRSEGEDAGGRPALATSLGDAPAAPVEGEAGGGVTKVSDTQYTVERKEVDNALANLSEVATQARIVPSFKNGKPNGFKLFSIKPGSIYSKIGLQNGDVIQKINGYEMNSPDKALEVYQKLRDASSVSIEMQRRGQSKQVNYSIR